MTITFERRRSADISFDPRPVASSFERIGILAKDSQFSPTDPRGRVFAQHASDVPT